MSFENDILRLMLLEKYLPECKPAEPIEISIHVTPNPLEIKPKDCTSVRFRDRTYRTQKFGDNIWMIDNLDLSLRSFGAIADEGTRSENGIKYYTWDDAMAVASFLSGWHLPSVKEWENLNKYHTCIGLDPFESEFNLYPTGYLDSDGRRFGSDRFAGFWTSDETADIANGVYFDLNDGQFAVCGYSTRSVARCVRLVKDD